MPLEIKELIVNTSISQSNNSSKNDDRQISDESYIRKLIKEEIFLHKNKIISDCIDKLSESNKLMNQR
jgi:hypothetical protein